MIELVEVIDKEQKRIYRETINEYHKYKNWKDYPGRRIGWIVYEDDIIVGVLGIASSPMNLGQRDKYIGWSRPAKMLHLNNIASNYRFCMIKTGMGRRVLSKLNHIAKERWLSKYGDKLLMLDTMVKPPFDGKVYTASGWIFVGMTKGISLKRPPSKSLLMKELDGRAGKNHKERAEKLLKEGWKKASKDVNYWNFGVTKVEPKKIFIKPLHRYWQKVLIKE